MANFKQLPYLAQIAIVTVVILLLAGGAYWFALVPMEKANEKDEKLLKVKQAEVAQLLPYASKLENLIAESEELQAKMKEQSKVVPERKEIPSLIQMVEKESLTSGIQIRRYTPKATTKKEYYIAVPVEVDVDGPFFSVLDFYTRLQNLDRIVSVSHLTMGSLKGNGNSGVKKTYRWRPNETVAASCVLTTYYSIPKPGAPPAGAKPAKPAKRKR
jgi:type IV pilus assembly protein PilO